MREKYGIDTNFTSSCLEKGSVRVVLRNYVKTLNARVALI